jgi:hypothetical protein
MEARDDVLVAALCRRQTFTASCKAIDDGVATVSQSRYWNADICNALLVALKGAAETQTASFVREPQILRFKRILNGQFRSSYWKEFKWKRLQDFEFSTVQDLRSKNLHAFSGGRKKIERGAAVTPLLHHRLRNQQVTTMRNGHQNSQKALRNRYFG